LLHTKVLLNHVGAGADVTLTSYVRLYLGQRLAAAQRVADFLDTKIRDSSPTMPMLLTDQRFEVGAHDLNEIDGQMTAP
jgi:uncharacterized protein (DUF111 family)